MSFKRYCCPELKFEKIFHLWYFSYSFGGLNVAILANLGQLTRDIIRAINA